MKETEVRAKAFAMPLTSPAFPPGPYRFVNREYLIITYRTDPERLRAVVPEPLEITEPVVKYEFIRMPDSTGFGDYTETGQVIPVSFQGRNGGYTHCMFLNDEPPIAGGRELWGFPKKLANPNLRTEIDMLVGTLDYGPVRVATATMEEITIKGAWTGPGALSLSPHAMAPVADLPVLQVLSTVHIVSDLTLGLGKVVYDYLAPSVEKPPRNKQKVHAAHEPQDKAAEFHR
jgi:acetoacetate decarboxylase